MSATVTCKDQLVLTEKGINSGEHVKKPLPQEYHSSTATIYKLKGSLYWVNFTGIGALKAIEIYWHAIYNERIKASMFEITFLSRANYLKPAKLLLKMSNDFPQPSYN